MNNLYTIFEEDIVVLRKKNGECFKDIRAAVSDDEIIILREDLHFEIGDEIDHH